MRVMRRVAAFMLEMVVRAEPDQVDKFEDAEGV